MTTGDAIVVLTQLRETLRLTPPSFETTQEALLMAIAALNDVAQLREVVREVAAIREAGRGDPAEPYDAQISLLTITKARRLMEVLG